MSEPTGVTYCTFHPNIESTLRCNRCERPICPKCAVLTPTGYRCPDCVKAQQKTFDTANWIDYPLAIGIAGIVSFLGSLVVPILGFFTIFIAPVAGVAIAEITRAATRKRRSKRLFQLAAAAAAAGALFPLLSLFVGSGGLGSLLSLVWQGFYAFMVTSTVYYRLAGIQMR